MKVGFALPSCNYNIVLTKEDVEKLLEGEYIFIRPDKEPSRFCNDHGVGYKEVPHYLRYDGQMGEYTVQFLGICMDKGSEG